MSHYPYKLINSIVLDSILYHLPTDNVNIISVDCC